MHKEAEEELKVRLKLVVLEFADRLNVTKACKEFNVPRSTFYEWKKSYDQEGQPGLYRKKPVAKKHPRKTPSEVIEKILQIRKEYQFGAIRIRYYLERYHGIQISKIHGEQGVEISWSQSCTHHRCPTRSSQQTVCQNGTRTPRAGGCEVRPAARSSGKDGDTIPIHRHR